MESFYTSRQAAEILGVSVTHFHRLARAGGIESVVEVRGTAGKIFRKEDVDKLGSKLRHPATRPTEESAGEVD